MPRCLSISDAESPAFFSSAERGWTGFGGAERPQHPTMAASAATPIAVHSAGYRGLLTAVLLDSSAARDDAGEATWPRDAQPPRLVPHHQLGLPAADHNRHGTRS